MKSLSFKRGKRLALKVVEKEREEIQYRLWLTRYPLYTQENFESFNEFCEKSKPITIVKTNKSKEEIMADIVPFYKLQQLKGKG